MMSFCGVADRGAPSLHIIHHRAEVVTVLGKSARPRFLNALKPLYKCSLRPFEQARRHLIAGRSVGIFPEGTVNRDPGRLLRGRRGAARLSLETGAPAIPMGIRFPTVAPDQPIPSHAAMELCRCLTARWPDALHRRFAT
jgi:1-acyl-sn-glycerol-3-phosphate acyltransferase